MKRTAVIRLNIEANRFWGRFPNRAVKRTMFLLLLKQCVFQNKRRDGMEGKGKTFLQRLTDYANLRKCLHGNSSDCQRIHCVLIQEISETEKLLLYFGFIEVEGWKAESGRKDAFMTGLRDLIQITKLRSYSNSLLKI